MSALPELIRDDKEMSRGQNLVEQRVARCEAALENAIVANGDRNPRVVVAALFMLLENNPDLSALFEDLCGKWVVKQVLRMARKHPGK